jgi:hypothetical protein
VLLQALTHQPTFGNKLVAFLGGDASVARSGYCIQLDGYAFERILGGLEPIHQFLEGHSPLALLVLELKGRGSLFQLGNLAFQDGLLLSKLARQAWG